MWEWQQDIAHPQVLLATRTALSQMLGSSLKEDNITGDTQWWFGDFVYENLKEDFNVKVLVSHP